MKFTAQFDETPHKVEVVEEKNGYRITIDDTPSFYIDVIDKLMGSYSVMLKNRSYEVEVESTDTQYSVLLKGRLYSLELINQKATLVKTKEHEENKLTAKMPGKIIKIMCKEGDEVTKDQGLIIMEAMKMENELKAPRAGKIKTIRVKEGNNVDAGADLITFE